ncbi:hypothetical protein M8C21_030919, partial [Ambrosia artemisiifolia]
ILSKGSVKTSNRHKKLEAKVEKVTKRNEAERIIQVSHELEEGNKLFQKHDNEGAMLKYEKALKLSVIRTWRFGITPGDT